MRMLLAWAAAGWAAAAPVPGGNKGPLPLPDDAVFGVMQAELTRSLKRLKLDDFGPPYLLVYRLVDQATLGLASSFGSSVSSDKEEERHVYVEARFGEPSFDNTDLRYHGWHAAASRSPEVLRQELWRLTDEAYKSAISSFLEKKARKATERDPDKLDDLSTEPAYVSSTPETSWETDEPALRATLDRASAEFRRHPFVYGCFAYAGVRHARRYLLTSEGTRIATPNENAPVLVLLSAWTRADDGMRLDNHRTWAVPSAREIPSAETLRREAAALSAELKTMREAPVQPPFAAPAILDPEFSGVLFHEALGHKLEGQRQRDPEQSQVFRDQVGSRILPVFISVLDDPTQKEFRGEALHGHYQYDSEGVPAQAVTLIERGVLRGLLMSRWPVKGFARSNGHGRADTFHHPSGRMANLVVVAHEPVPVAALKERLMALARAAGKPYGFWLKGSGGGENPNNRRSAQTLEVRPRLVFRVDALTGEESMVRGVKLVGTPLRIELRSGRNPFDNRDA